VEADCESGKKPWQVIEFRSDNEDTRGGLCTPLLRSWFLPHWIATRVGADFTWQGIVIIAFMVWKHDMLISGFH
jgi:hypothetical protein